MRLENEQRIHQIQSRARLLGTEENALPPVVNNFPTRKQNKSPGQSLPFGDFFKNADEDKILILALLWLLWNEHADRRLLLALLYLLF